MVEALGGVGFTHYTVSNHYFLGAVAQVGYVAMLKTLSVCQKYFFSIKCLHVYLQYICNISTKR